MDYSCSRSPDSATKGTYERFSVPFHNIPTIDRYFGVFLEPSSLASQSCLVINLSQSLYSMSVLPNSASLRSFFIVFALFFVFTIAMVAFNLRILSTQISQLGSLVKLSAACSNAYINGYLKLNLYEEYDLDEPLSTHSIFYLILWYIMRKVPTIILRRCLLYEIYMPNERYILWL